MNMFSGAALAWALAGAAPAAEPAPPLRLEDAVAMALSARDPAAERFEAKAEALEDRAVAEAQLPDPTARVGLANFPVDTLAFEQEPMTQIQAGLRQEFPKGDTLTFKGERRRAEAGGERARKALALRKIERETRLAWLDRYYWTQSQDYIRQSREAVDELIDSLSAAFASGLMTSQDVLRAELELALLDDRLAELRRQEAAAQAVLARYVGEASARPMPAALPAFADPPSLEIMETALADHPAARVKDAEVLAQSIDTEIAEEAYKPSWALEGGYGLRGGGRADFASVGVSVSIPLFTGKRQDKRLSAEIKERSAAELARSAELLDLRRDLGRAYADWTGLQARIDLYDQAVTVRAGETAEASIAAYGGGNADFPELIRSQLAELDAELNRLKLRVDQAKAWAELDYLTGGAP
ncbi:MAG: TolC family protein [Euryhalocaulis sp.]|uniref:TolC family protein n=1 Tax=Euryhalocaulis sp. TaxID=2744307 RepID=UPI0017BFFA2C|nr:TolC family protein [Euryhalocaulis sp.]MBA4801356.1 TolC family protein [Euryhalocaulis sp.]